MNRDTTETIESMSNVTKLHTRDWYEIRNVTDEAADIFIYDQIGEDWWTGEGITSKAFIGDLNGIKARRINLHVNSPGGSVFDGLAIANALQRHPAHVTTFIDGLAASIASIIALAGDHIVMAKNSMFMIHNPSGGVQGDATDMRKMADVLDKIRDTLVNAYQSRTNASRDDIVAALEAETWYSADEALEAGFIDEVSSSIKAAAHFDLSRFPFRHAPQNISEPEQGCGSETCGNCDCKPVAAQFVNVLEMETFVSFVAADGETEQGRIEHVMTEGVLGIPGSRFSIEATPENPAALVRIWDEEDGVWLETENLKARTFDALTEIAPLTEQQTQPEENTDSDEGGAPDVGISVGATEPRRTEAFVEGLGFIKL